MDEMAKQLFEADRGERENYKAAASSDYVKLPITKDGFEALLEEAGERFDLPVDDVVRSVFCGYLHHIGGDTDEVTLEVVGRVIRKAHANRTSYWVDQQIKEAAQKAEHKRKLEEERLKMEASDAGIPPGTGKGPKYLDKTPN